ncbi:MAG TPA: MerR family transcriptional regulator [Ignavibacteria bacterium]|nr:MerR family transcriptional regulator [Ignavibacteria bacterium]
MTTLDTPLYTISTAAKLVGVSVHTLRLYENEGFIIPFKKESKQRLYSDLDIERLKCLRKVINEERIGFEGIRRILSLIPCWGLVKCTAKDRENCESFNSASKPCWMINHKNNYCTGRDCRECEVYQSFNDCESIKDKLKELIVPIN